MFMKIAVYINIFIYLFIYLFFYNKNYILPIDRFTILSNINLKLWNCVQEDKAKITHVIPMVRTF